MLTKTDTQCDRWAREAFVYARFGDADAEQEVHARACWIIGERTLEYVRANPMPAEVAARARITSGQDVYCTNPRCGAQNPRNTCCRACGHWDVFMA